MKWGSKKWGEAVWAQVYSDYQTTSPASNLLLGESITRGRFIAGRSLPDNLVFLDLIDKTSIRWRKYQFSLTLVISFNHQSFFLGQFYDILPLWSTVGLRGDQGIELPSYSGKVEVLVFRSIIDSL